MVLLAAALVFATACGAKDRESAPSGEASGSGAASGVTAEAKARSVAAAGARLEHDGVSLEVPDGWDGRVLGPAILQVANFKFVPVGTELPPGEEDPIKAMTAKHALVTALSCGLVSWEEAAQAAPDDISLDDLTFLPAERVPRGHSVAHGSFEFSGRCLRVEVDFGGTSPGPKLMDTVNSILGSLSVDGGSQPTWVPPGELLSRDPYMGVSCRIANSIECDRVGLAVWLRQPAKRVDASIAGRQLKLDDPEWSEPAENGERRFFAGFLQPAGLIDGPLQVTPETGTDRWFGREPVSATVDLWIVGDDGRVSTTTVEVGLSPGWG